MLGNLNHKGLFRVAMKAKNVQTEGISQSND